MIIQKLVRPNVPDLTRALRPSEPPPNHPEDGLDHTPIPHPEIHLGRQLAHRVREDGLVMVGGLALFAGIGAAIGSLFGAPGVGAIKGAEILGIQAVASEIFENRGLESRIFNWSKVMPGSEATPRDIDLETNGKNKALFYANLATNAAVVSGVGAAMGGVLGGVPGAIIGGSLTIIGGSLLPAFL